MSEHLLNNILQDMQLDPDEQSTDKTILVYKNLIDIIYIFLHCQATLPWD
jgi:hypothetical protein